MSDFKFSQYKAIIFDVYATLIDWETGVYEGIKPLLERTNSPLARSKKDALTAYFNVESDLQARHPSMLYADILTRAHAELEARLKGEPSHPETTMIGIVTSAPTTTTTTSAHTETGTSDEKSTSAGTSISGSLKASIEPNEAEHVAFGQSIPTWKPFPDTIPALAYLSTKFKLSVLSNVDHKSFCGTRAVLETSIPEHQFKFDAIYTAEDIGSYKPSLANFEYALAKLKEEFGVERDEVLIVAASLSHDHVPANALGLASIYIDRNAISLNHDAASKSAKYNAKFPTLGAFAEEVRRQAQGS